jgi:subtilisin family serine protease
MDSVILKRGNSTISLEKSEDAIGLRTKSISDLKAVLPTMDEGMSWVDTSKVLAGFHIINIKGPKDIDFTLDQLREHEMINVGSHVYHTPQSRIPYIPTGKITLRFDPAATEAEKQLVIDSFHLQVVESRIKDREGTQIEETFIVSVTPQSPNPLKVALELQHMKNITLAEPDLSTPGKLAQFDPPADPLFKEQWHLQNKGLQFGSSLGLKAGADARVVQAWEIMGSFGNPECVIAIIDDGFDLGHPDLSGPGKIVAPWDFQTKTADPTPKYMTQYEGDYHGTACAGIAVGSHNDVGIVGVAPDCRLMPIRWGGNINDDAIEDWFFHAMRNGAWIINSSWCASAANYVLSTRQLEAIEECANKGRNGLGCVIVFAAGNSNTDVNDPQKETVNGFAIHPNVISVAACTSRDERSAYSNYGKEITVCAPSDGQGGRGLLTADVRGKFTFQGVEYFAGNDVGDYFRGFGGTSGAAPLVSGVCGLILSLNPKLTARAVKEILKETARKIGEPADFDNGHSVHFGYGCINAEEAINFIFKSIQP